MIVGFGPAGECVARSLEQTHKELVVVVELNTKSADIARAYGFRTHIGDASSPEVLEHLRVGAARVVVVTVPDPAAARQIVGEVRSQGPDTSIIARARYHRFRSDLALAGAVEVIDEEEQVGIQMASAVQEELRTGVAHE